MFQVIHSVMVELVSHNNKVWWACQKLGEHKAVGQMAMETPQFWNEVFLRKLETKCCRVVLLFLNGNWQKGAFFFTSVFHSSYALQTSTGSIHPCPLCHTAGCCSTVWWSRAFLHVQHAVIVLIWQFKFSEGKKGSIWKLTGFEWQVLIFLVWNNLLFQNTEKQEGGVVKRPNWRETRQLTRDFFSSLWNGISPFNKGK